MTIHSRHPGKKQKRTAEARMKFHPRFVVFLFGHAEQDFAVTVRLFTQYLVMIVYRQAN